MKRLDIADHNIQFGSINSGDIVKRIIRIQQNPLGKQYFIEWKTRQGGTQPESSVLPAEVVIQKAPHAVIQFLQPRINWRQK